MRRSLGGAERPCDGRSVPAATTWLRILIISLALAVPASAQAPAPEPALPRTPNAREIRGLVHALGSEEWATR